MNRIDVAQLLRRAVVIARIRNILNRIRGSLSKLDQRFAIPNTSRFGVRGKISNTGRLQRSALPKISEAQKI